VIGEINGGYHVATKSISHSLVRPGGGPPSGRRSGTAVSGHARKYGTNCKNPVTDAGYVAGLNPIKPQKEKARRALLAREHFRLNGPPDAPPLPLSHTEREDLKGRSLLPHIVAWYARSLEARGYDVEEHPSFADYVSGVLWEAELPGGLVTLSPDCPDELGELKKRFPPRMLKGMSNGLYCYPPKLHAEHMASWRRNSDDPQRYFERA
jgi:hypothetical protein